MKHLGKFLILIVSYLLLQSPAIAADKIEIKQEGNKIIIIKNGQRKIIDDIPKQDGWLSLKETLETIKEILDPSSKRAGNANHLNRLGVNTLDVSQKTEHLHFCYVASKPIKLWHPDKQRNRNLLTLQPDNGKLIKKRWKPGHYFDWKSGIENGATYTIAIGGYSLRVTLHEVSDNVIPNNYNEDYGIGQEMAQLRCAQQALLFMSPDVQIMFAH